MSSHTSGYMWRAGECLWYYSIETADTRIFENYIQVHFNEPIGCFFKNALGDFPV